MHEKQIATLKHIALMGGVHDYIAISSRELGNVLEISQQSASKKILELLGDGLIERDLGARGQRIKLTAMGIEIDDGQGGAIKFTGPKVSINNGALEVV